MKEFRPIISFHPGRTLKNKLDEIGMTLDELSKKTKIPKRELVKFIKGKIKVNDELVCVKNGKVKIIDDFPKLLESATGISSKFLIAKQKNYDRYKDRRIKQKMEEEHRKQEEYVRRLIGYCYNNSRRREIENEFTPDIAFHPVRILIEKLEEMNTNISIFSEKVNLPFQKIKLFIKGKIGITPEMVDLFEVVLGIPSYFWLDMQRDYDEFMIKKGKK